MRSATARLEIRATFAQANKIVQLHRDYGLSCAVLAQRFNINSATISKILKQAREKRDAPNLPVVS